MLIYSLVVLISIIADVVLFRKNSAIVRMFADFQFYYRDLIYILAVTIGIALYPLGFLCSFLIKGKSEE